jgi:Zinc finger, C3HC4 type (RING finger)
MDDKCPICLDEFKKDDITITKCNHQFCKECYKKLSACAICRRPITKMLVKLDENKTISLDYIFC